ncbi:ABC transporter permease subunit [Streptomyces erythrochromogenes]|uniref:ABC transporter permease n=1 Tax=Streptomyces erythrochromogenes TaxID=285574 RepID=UPI00386D5CD7
MADTMTDRPTGGRPSTGRRPPADRAADGRRLARRRKRRLAVVFVLPALLLLGALVVYPVLFSFGRSLFDADGNRFVGAANYAAIVQDPATLKAIRNSAVWVVVAPTLLTGLGLMLAVLTEKVRWATAFKLVLFLPMAVSFLAAGIIFRLAYEHDPDRGVLNAAAVAVHDGFDDAAAYPTARAREGHGLTGGAGGPYSTAATVRPGGSVGLGFIGVAPEAMPAGAKAASDPAAPAGAAPAADAIGGVVYLDFAPGGAGTPGRVDPGEKGLPGMTVEAVRDGRVAATATTAEDGSFRFAGLADGDYSVRLPAANFEAPYQGVNWLGPALVTPAIIGAYLWVWTGFSMVLIGAGLAAIPRDALEAARMDGATEGQIFRKITVPLLAPVLTVVFVTLVINVMKVFDLVWIIAPGPVQEEANVLATRMWLVSFGGGNDQGLGSALSMVLLLLVVPAMIFNVRRFRRSGA